MVTNYISHTHIAQTIFFCIGAPTGRKMSEDNRLVSLNLANSIHVH